MRTVLVAGLRAHAGRLVATAVAVVLSVAFLVGTLALTATFVRTTQEALTASMARADVWVGATDDAAPPADGDVLGERLDAVRGAARVAAADVERSVLGKVRVGGTWATARTSALLDEAVRWQELARGRWPAAPDEATLDESAARDLGVDVGDDVVLQPFGHDAVTLGLVGITQGLGPAVVVDMPQLVVTRDGLDAAAGGTVATEILVRGDGAPPAEVVASVSAALGDAPGLLVLTRDEVTQRRVSQLSGSATVLTGILLGFCVVTLVVAAIVIANTFHVLVAQRTRELALLRCIGAGVGQVHRLVLGEAAVLGALASVVGVAVGLAGAHVLARARMTPDGAVVTPLMAAAGLAVGVVLTVVAAWPPARRATRVRPVEALRPVEAGLGGPSRRRAVLGVVVRCLVAVLLLAAGGAGALLGARERGLAVAVPAVVVSFVGVLVLAPLVVPGCVRAVGALVARASAATRLAAANATRNRRRTTATATALLVGVTLVTGMVVATASVRSSVDAEIDASRPVDLVVLTSDPEGLDDATVATVRDLPEVVATSEVRGGVPLRLELPDGTTRALVARGVAPDAVGRVARAEVPVPAPGGALVHPDDAADLPGGPVPAVGEQGRAEVDVEVTSRVSPGTVTVRADELTDLVGPAHRTELQARLVPDLSGAEVQRVISAILSIDPRIDVGGGAPERATYRELLDTMLVGVLALLTLALVIAVVGIGNTLALSVVERRRESALLRALGLGPGQLRGMLAVEAALVAVVAAVLGVALGVAYAWTGVMAVGVEATRVPMHLVVPRDQLGAIVGAAVLAGVVASLLPGQRAARVSPAEALTVD